MSRSITSNVLLVLVLLLPSVSWGAIVRTGSVSSTTSAANSGSTSVTVPADAELMAVCASGYQGTASYFSSGSVTIGGAAMTAVAADGNTSFFMGSLFYKALPSTGTQPLAWDWAGTTAPNDGVLITYGFYKGVNTSSPVRSSNATQQTASPHTTGTLTAVTGDLIVACVSQFAGSEATFVWTGATNVSEFPVSAGADASWAEASPTGNQTVTADGTPDNDGGIMAIVLQPPSGGAPISRNLLLLGAGP